MCRLFGCIPLCVYRIRIVFIFLLVLHTSRLKGKLLPESVEKLQPATLERESRTFHHISVFFLTRMKLNSAGVSVNIHRHRPLA